MPEVSLERRYVYCVRGSKTRYQECLKKVNGRRWPLKWRWPAVDAKELCEESCKISQVCHLHSQKLSELSTGCRIQCLEQPLLHWCYLAGTALIAFGLLSAHRAYYCAGVQSVDIDLAQQKVLVKGDVSQDDILQTVSKTGKKTELWQ